MRRRASCTETQTRKTGTIFFFFLAELLIFWRPWEAQDSQHFSYVISVYPLFNPEQILIQISFSTSPQVNAHVTIISWALWELGLSVLTVWVKDGRLP